MHRALQILEVAELICEQVTERWHILEFVCGTAPRELSTLARTSTIFLNPAFSVLWRHQKTILNLLRTISDDVWSVAMECVNADVEMGGRKIELDIVRTLFSFRI
ncbi:hypothetical protein C8R43DRAFT_954686 [Mycena crocata]|nr:hypothetical protein C8R43DRAFT_954686 [Mycena crocata]